MLTLNFIFMIKNGKVNISYKELCDIVGELETLLGPTHKTVAKLKTLKENQETQHFRSGVIWHIITGKQTELRLTNGEVADFINHAFPDIQYEPPYEFPGVSAYIKPLLIAKFPDFEKYSNDKELEEAVGISVRVSVLKVGIENNWRIA